MRLNRKVRVAVFSFTMSFGLTRPAPLWSSAPVCPAPIIPTFPIGLLPRSIRVCNLYAGTLPTCIKNVSGAQAEQEMCLMLNSGRDWVFNLDISNKFSTRSTAPTEKEMDSPHLIGSLYSSVSSVTNWSISIFSLPSPCIDPEFATDGSDVCPAGDRGLSSMKLTQSGFLSVSKHNPGLYFSSAAL